jgi:hypothetical protein
MLLISEIKRPVLRLESEKIKIDLSEHAVRPLFSRYLVEIYKKLLEIIDKL